MMPNDPFTGAIDAGFQELRAAQERAGHGLRDALVRAAAAARESALAEARSQIETAAAERLEASLKKARAEAAEMLARARAEQAQALAAADAAAEERLREAVAELRRNSETARADADAAAAERLAQAVDEVRISAESAADARLADALAAARADAELALARARDQQVRSLQGDATHLVKAIRDLDRAGSLSEILDAFALHAGRQAPRVAVLLVQGDQAGGWRFSGFDDIVTDPRSLRLSLSSPAAGVLTAALRRRAPSSTGEGRDGSAPSFAGLDPGGSGLAVPIEVGGRVVALVYADDHGNAAQARAGWQDALEAIARHAGRCLETLTALRMRGAVVARPEAPAAAAGPAAESAGAPPAGDGDAARRYAKLLISEIRLYHEADVTAGRRERNLFDRLGGEIERARGLYNARIPAAARADYFNQELVRTLADGDPALLGHSR
jgi:hypothetical protein